MALSILGWVTTWFGMLLIPGVEISTCTMGSDDAWLGSLLVFTPVTVVGVGLTFLDVRYSDTLKWFSTPHIFLIPYAAYTAVNYLIGSTLKGMHVCSIAYDSDFESYPISSWQPFWAPVQIVLIVFLLYSIFKFWTKKVEKSG